MSDFQRAFKIIMKAELFIVMTISQARQDIITVIMRENAHSRSYVLDCAFDFALEIFTNSCT